MGSTGCPTIGCYGRDQLTLADLWLHGGGEAELVAQGCGLDPERAPRLNTSHISAAWAFAVIGGAFGALVGLLVLVVFFVTWVVS